MGTNGFGTVVGTGIGVAIDRLCVKTTINTSYCGGLGMAENYRQRKVFVLISCQHPNPWKCHDIKNISKPLEGSGVMIWLNQ